MKDPLDKPKYSIRQYQELLNKVARLETVQRAEAELLASAARYMDERAALQDKAKRTAAAESALQEIKSNYRTMQHQVKTLRKHVTHWKTKCYATTRIAEGFQLLFEQTRG